MPKSFFYCSVVFSTVCLDFCLTLEVTSVLDNFSLLLLCSCFYGEKTLIFFRRQIVYGTIPVPLPLGQPHSIFKGWPSTHCIFMCPVSGMAANAWDFFMCMQVLMLSAAYRGLTNTVRESAPKADWQENALPQQGVKLVWTVCQPMHSANQTTPDPSLFLCQ